MCNRKLTFDASKRELGLQVVDNRKQRLNVQDELLRQ